MTAPDYRFPFTPYPTGWFWIASAAELERGAVLTKKIFGEEVVIFRTEAGRPTVVEAHCPHLGAHLGHGGRVEGETIVCPFHGWKLDADGAVADVPYSKHKPPKVCIRSWPIREKNGQILIWHDDLGRPPSWEPPVIPEASDPEWTGLRPAKRWMIRTHVQELAENGVDNAHFTWLHTQQTMGMRTDDVEIDGERFCHHTWQDFNLFGLMNLFVDEVNGPLDVNFHGLGIIVNRATVHAGIDLFYTFAFFARPIEPGLVEFVSFLSMKKLKSRIGTWLLWKKACEEGGVTIGQDLPIWENKAYKTRPVLLPEDGPVRTFRKWSAQFYPEQGSQQDTEAAK